MLLELSVPMAGGTCVSSVQLEDKYSWVTGVGGRLEFKESKSQQRILQGRDNHPALSTRGGQIYGAILSWHRGISLPSGVCKELTAVNMQAMHTLSSLFHHWPEKELCSLRLLALMETTSKCINARLSFPPLD